MENSASFADCVTLVWSFGVIRDNKFADFLSDQNIGSQLSPSYSKLLRSTLSLMSIHQEVFKGQVCNKLQKQRIWAGFDGYRTGVHLKAVLDQMAQLMSWFDFCYDCHLAHNNNNTSATVTSATVITFPTSVTLDTPILSLYSWKPSTGRLSRIIDPFGSMVSSQPCYPA